MPLDANSLLNKTVDVEADVGQTRSELMANYQAQKQMDLGIDPSMSAGIGMNMP